MVRASTLHRRIVDYLRFDTLSSLLSLLWAVSLVKIDNHSFLTSLPSRGSKKKASQMTCFFLFNPKDWYGITRRVHGIAVGVWHHRRCGFLRINSIHHFVTIPYHRQAADCIQRFALIIVFRREVTKTGSLRSEPVERGKTTMF